MEPRLIKRTVDLVLDSRQERGWAQRLMLSGAALADQLQLTVLTNGEPVDLQGVTPVAYFQTPDGDVAVQGTVNGAQIHAEFPAEAYAYEGLMTLTVFLSDGSRNVPLYQETFVIGHGRGKVVLDPQKLIPDVTAVVAMLDQVRAATAGANSAAAAAVDAAEEAKSIANKAAQSAQQTADNAAAQAVNIAQTAGKEAVDIANEAAGTLEAFKAGISADINSLTVEAALQSDPLPNTTQQYTFAADGTISRIDHMRDGTPVRTDAFTFAENAVVEVRTLATGESLTITTNLITLETTAQYAA